MENNNKQEPKTQRVHYRFDNTSSELPNITIALTDASGDFITSHLHLSASSWNPNEVLALFERSLEYLERLRNKNKPKG